MPNVKISAVGCYTPPRLLTNFDLEKMVDTSNDWILSRVGIHTRHIADPEIATSDMAVEAAKIALARRGIDASEIETIIVATVTPDMLFPSTACIVQDKLGAKAWGFDLIAACCSFLYALNAAANMVRAGAHRKVLVIGSDTMSRIIDYTDRATCVLFGDGAGAFVVERAADGEPGFIDFEGEVDGSGGQYLNMPAGGSRMPPSHETVDKRLHYVKQEGQQVFKFAVRRMSEVCRVLLERNNLTVSDIALMIPHQANRRIITVTAEKLGMPCDRVMIDIEKYGNTTSATLPLATQDAIEEGRLKKGDLVLYAAVGAGYTIGASLWRWAI